AAMGSSYPSPAWRPSPTTAPPTSPCRNAASRGPSSCAVAQRRGLRQLHCTRVSRRSTKRRRLCANPVAGDGAPVDGSLLSEGPDIPEVWVGRLGTLLDRQFVNVNQNRDGRRPAKENGLPRRQAWKLPQQS